MAKKRLLGGKTLQRAEKQTTGHQFQSRAGPLFTVTPVTVLHVTLSYRSRQLETFRTEVI